jgi:hypothetical protein
MEASFRPTCTDPACQTAYRFKTSIGSKCHRRDPPLSGLDSGELGELVGDCHHLTWVNPWVLMAFLATLMYH